MASHVLIRRRGLGALSALTLAFGAFAVSAQPAFAATQHRAPSSPYHASKPAHTRHRLPSTGTPSNTNPMTYHGGPVQDSPTVYVVYWGSQWGSGSITNDPNGEASLQSSFFSSLYGSGDNWSTSTTQYCSGITTGSTDCSGATTFVGHPSSNPLGGTWLDDSAAAPSAPTASDIQAEAIKAAQHFGVTGTNVQIIVDSPTGVVPEGFVGSPGDGLKYCAWHDSASMPDGSTITYTNFPYVADVGQSCGANYVNVGGSGVDPASEGVTEVGGHEYGETVTDPAPSSGWITDNDSTGGENGDKCSWSNGTYGIASLNGTNFAVQPLWSNNANNGSGGCDLYYNSATDQG